MMRVGIDALRVPEASNLICCIFGPLRLLTIEFHARKPRRLASTGLAGEHESCDETRIRKFRQTSDGLSANRWRTPGSWERSRISDIDSPLTRTLPSQRSGGFFILQRHAFEIFPARAGTGDPDPGAQARIRACARSAGPVGGNGARPSRAVHRWRGEPLWVRYGGAQLMRAPRRQ